MKGKSGGDHSGCALDVLVRLLIVEMCCVYPTPTTGMIIRQRIAKLPLYKVHRAAYCGVLDTVVRQRQLKPS